MALLNPTFICGVVVLLYLSSFVLFAVLRILTGISIQRIGYLSLRRLAYTPKDGIKIKIRGLGLHVHRPTFSQPTWLSIVLSELVVTVDVESLEGHKADGQEGDDGEGAPGAESKKSQGPKPPLPRRATVGLAPGETWKQLTKIKEKIKKLHRIIHWLRLVDVVASNTTVDILGVGNVQCGSFTLAVDTRHKMVDRARFFLQSRSIKGHKQQAEWILTVRSVLFTANGGEASEVLDNAVLNIHGFVYEDLDGLRDTAIALKLGRVHIPYDDVQVCMDRHKRLKQLYSKTFQTVEAMEVSVDKVVQELDNPGSTDQDIMQAVSDSKVFMSSLLRGIKEVQFAVSLVSLTKKVEDAKATGAPLLLNASMKEVGIDLHRLDPKSPAHRMYFPSKDIAHEALLAALSISVGLDDGQGKPERILYIPMATTTIKTTLPSKTVELTDEGSAEEKNANIMFANSVVTSPSVDLDPKHLPVLLALLRPKPKAPKTKVKDRHMLISRLLPKANVKFTMHEPVLRIALPPVIATNDPDDFDLIISSISSISLDLESLHSAVEEQHYSLVSQTRVQTHELYYQTVQGNRYDLVETEYFDLKVTLGASPDVNVMGHGHLQSLAVHLVRPEITDGIREILRQVRVDVEPDKRDRETPQKPRGLRAMPQWLLHFKIAVEEFSVEVAGIDDDFPNNTRGVALQIDSWSSEYRAQRMDAHLRRRPASRRRALSRAIMPDPDILKSPPPSPHKNMSEFYNDGDGRKLSVHLRGVEAFIIDNAEKWELDPFIHMPKFEMGLSTSSDKQGPMLHVHAHLRTILLQYSLYRHYSVGVAVTVLMKAFMRATRDTADVKATQTHSPRNPSVDHLSPPIVPPDSPATDKMNTSSRPTKELVTMDFKATLIQIKAQLPEDPPVMLQLYGMEVGRHRWSSPFVFVKLIRLHAEAPRMPGVWARIATIKSARVDYRESRRVTAFGSHHEDKMIDIVTEAMRLSVPHEMVFYKISDNIVNVIKATEQLHHRFKTGTNEYILDKGPEGPKNVPKVSLRSRTLLFEIEDGAFEWKLGIIYRAGQVEQMQRLAREEAYRVKAKKIQEEEFRKGSNRTRNRSAMTRGRSTQDSPKDSRSKSEDTRPRTGIDGYAHDDDHTRHRRPRYDPDGVRGFSGNAHISIQEARQRLDEHHAQSWKQRIDRHYLMAKNGMKDLRSLLWGSDSLPDDMEDQERVLEPPQRPALMSAVITDLHFVVDKPSFPLHQLPDFLHQVGKGMPKDMQYSLLVPMSVQLSISEAKLTLRDYPLPLFHVPAIKPGQPSRLPALSLKSDFVIAEEYRGRGSTRRIKVQITPPTRRDDGLPASGSFAIDVCRTIGPVKSFSDVHVDINTAYPTRITWCPSYQPAIQDMMVAIESFTKPQLDLSEKVGFWDKIRLSFHSSVRVAWKGDGDVHLALKGSRDPYQVTGDGAGFLMCWRNDVRWNVHADDDPKNFMTVDSGECVLAIPDYSHQVREASRKDGVSDSLSSEDDFEASAAFKKVVMKLSGRVQWMAGLMFEQAIEDGKRDFTFKPHYEVVVKSPDYADPNEEEAPYDAFRGFRSQNIHLSIAVRAPVDRDWTSIEPQTSRSYNTVHLTPRFFTHFFNWLSLFGGPMSLPVRQGALWPNREKNSKKFGRHLGTIKYNLLLAPLFLSHIYKHKDAEDHAENSVSATGIKVRFDSFMVDMHQRREEFNTRDRGRKTQTRTTGMKLHAAQLDLVSADVRAVSASIKSTASEAVKKKSRVAGLGQEDEGADLSHFTIPDNDLSWIDMDDFVELDSILPTEANPDTKILPLGFAPRVTYFRQTDIGGVIAGDPDRTSPFGDEPTHICIMRQNDNPRSIQTHLTQERLEQLAVQIEDNIRKVGELELRVIRDGANDPQLQAQFETFSKHTEVLKEKKVFMENMLSQLSAADSSRNTSSGEPEDSQIPPDPADGDGERDPNLLNGAEFASDFTNRFVIHNMQLKWNNLLRNIILRYSHQVSQRRGFVYYLSRPAVKFILDIVEEQTKAKSSSGKTNQKATKEKDDQSARPSSKGTTREVNEDIEHRIKQILQDGRKFVNADDTSGPNQGTPNVPLEAITSGISDDFVPQSAYHVRLIAPQIQLQSEKNKKHVVLVTAKGMELKVVEVMEKARLFDSVSGLVQRRFLVGMDSTQFFVTHQKWFSTQLLALYSGNRYGTPAGSSWPPWVPMEVMYDFERDPFGFKRVVQKTSAMLRYDKYNTLRLKFDDDINDNSEEGGDATENAESRMDNLWVEFPQARALCNSSQYYAIYVIVLDLLLYNEPLEKTRNERLEKIMLASDFSDLRGTPEMVTRLQERIRQLEDIKGHFQLHHKDLDRQGLEDRLLLERDLAACEDELFFMMKAITTSQQKYDTTSQSNALLRWSISAREIVWHLIRDNNEPLVELQLRDVEYDRTDNSDGSHINLFQVGKVLGLNLLPDAMYPEMIVPYFDAEKVSPMDIADKQMVRVYWHMLEAIAGIPVMDHFELNLFPMKIQLEREVGKKLFEYVFPNVDEEESGTGNGSNAQGRTDSPFMLKQNVQEADDDDADAESMSGSTRLGPSSISDRDPAFDTRAGSLEHRLRPTLNSESRAPESSPPKTKAASVNSNEGHVFRLFGGKTLTKKTSHESLNPNLTAPRPGVGRATTFASNQGDKKAARFKIGNRAAVEEKPSDDLSKMMERASNYMTFAYIKMPSVVLCLSYKGKGDRNLEDVHDFVFRLPTIEYRNKTWSNLDLALALKSRVIKALISHTGAIIGNKFSKHKPNIAQQSKLREMATSNVLLATPTIGGSGDTSDDASSIFGTSPVDYSRSPPQSVREGQGSITAPQRNNKSRSSSVASSQRSNGATPGSAASSLLGGGDQQDLRRLPTFLMMTPPTLSDRSLATGLGIGTSSSRSTSSPRPQTSAGMLEVGDAGIGDRRQSTGGPGAGGAAAGTSGGSGNGPVTGSGSGSGSGGFFRGKLSAFANRRKEAKESKESQALARSHTAADVLEGDDETSSTAMDEASSTAMDEASSTAMDETSSTAVDESSSTAMDEASSTAVDEDDGVAPDEELPNPDPDNGGEEEPASAPRGKSKITWSGRTKTG